MALADREFLTDKGRRLTLRGTHPLSTSCPMHLRRICGTCAAFPSGADMRAKAQRCTRLHVTINGARCAAGCKLWARKTARPVKQLKSSERGKI